MDGVDDRLAIMNARKNVARRDPAADPVRLQRGAGGIGHSFIPGGVADENVMRHERELPFCLGLLLRVQHREDFSAPDSSTTVFEWTRFSPRRPSLQYGGASAGPLRHWRDIPAIMISSGM